MKSSLGGPAEGQPRPLVCSVRRIRLASLRAGGSLRDAIRASSTLGRCLCDGSQLAKLSIEAVVQHLRAIGTPLCSLFSSVAIAGREVEAIPVGRDPATAVSVEPVPDQIKAELLMEFVATGMEPVEELLRAFLLTSVEINLHAVTLLAERQRVVPERA